MMKHLKNILSAILFLAITSGAYAQAGEPLDEMMRPEGKINVVITVLSIIVVGLGIYLFSMDKKISKLEKNSKK